MKVLHLRTGCRLHFGLMELAAEQPMRFAGLGLMLDHPGFELAFSAAESPTVEVSCVERQTSATADAAPVTSAKIQAEFENRIRAVMLRRRTLATDSAQNPASYHARLLNALPLHSGLGAGTQLAASVAAGLELFARDQEHPANHGSSVSAGACPEPCPTTAAVEWQAVLNSQPTLSAEWLSQHADRGLRSAVGLVGFLRGGLILDEGYNSDYAHDEFEKRIGRPLAAKTLRLASEWRVVLTVPQQRAELSGAMEAEVMAELGSLPNPHRKQMLELAQRATCLAANENQFAEFTDCLDQYMQFGAQLFSRYQGGIYNGADVTEAVQRAQAVGLRGVGQSSWGPTVFGFAKSQASAQRYVEQLCDQRPDWSVCISTPTTSGAQYRWQSIH